ncbi:glycosyltransferase family 2 protein [Lutibacter sp.]|uniref:glycosyltransferase family 2 protein n=1 Tax=Lutibacter sp. TaxID=1925666 RepID=UPI0025C187F3|nr:glycosyltransferase family 2 protein [Lutibacter sp.]MCF6182427.1 glycosyltransferase family 2 protein [Lutibacter sp.]
MDISIIIVNYRSWNLLKNCLLSLQIIEQDKFTFEVIVVDNSINKKTLNSFKQQFLNVYFYQNQDNNGFSHGNNLGVKKAIGNYFLFLNPDTIITKKVIYNLHNKAKNNNDYAIISCQQINNRGKKQDIRKFFPSPLTHFGISRAVYRFINKQTITSKFNNLKEIVFPDWVSGSLLLISKTWFTQIGGWDEDFWLYYEDVDICKKASNLNGKIALLQNISITHLHGGSSRLNLQLKTLTKMEVIISQHVYLNKHFRGVERYLFHLIIMLFILFEKFLFAILGAILIFIPKFRMHIIFFFKLLKYYIQVPLNRSWLSSRSVNFKKRGK